MTVLESSEPKLIARGNGWGEDALFTNILAYLRGVAANAALFLTETSTLADLDTKMNTRFGLDPY